MSSDPIRRRETTHIDEVARTATSTTQWFAEKLHATHPISHNNRLKMFVCGEEGFADIQTQLENAKESIDLICWGFDPGMELKRGSCATWPKGKTYGDLLIECGRRGVQVRLLVWYNPIIGYATKNMPGHTHGTWHWRTNDEFDAVDKLSAQHSLALQTNRKDVRHFVGSSRVRISSEMIPMLAREEYCHSWYKAALRMDLQGIRVRTRDTEGDSVRRSLGLERYQPGALTDLELERAGLIHAATHHQKTILIDFMHDEGRKAIGYVMGLNSVTDYWDTCEHKLEDPRRERGGKKTASEAVQPLSPDIKPDAGFLSLKPYQDYACRIDGGKALIALYNNFVTAWDRSIDDRMRTAATDCVKRYTPSPCKAPPVELLRPAAHGDSTVQIVRTQPDEGDKSIKDIYNLATDAACLASGYLYIENQYFQNEEWAERLISKRKAVVAAWKRAAAKLGKGGDDMPMMHVFIVIPVPELEEMIPSTHDSLSVLSESEGMTGQIEMIDKANKKGTGYVTRDAKGIPKHVQRLPAVVKHANEIGKRNTIQLDDVLGLKVSVAMLQTSGFDKRRWRYREIYIHSKLMLVDDEFMTLGSANLNQRSMAVDSELNIATNDAQLVRSLRERVWKMHSGGKVDCKSSAQTDIQDAFEKWKKTMNANLASKKRGEPMVGFLLPLADLRNSTIRLG